MKQNVDKKRILIAGGAGFIGTHLCERLLKEDNYVICLDDFSSGRLANISHHKDNNNFEIIEHDVINPIKLSIDEIYNLACPASPKHYQENPIRTLKTSVNGAENLLNLAEMNNSKILQASTSEVYGDPIVHPQTETYWGNVNPIGIRACYDEGKRCAETLFFDYQRNKGVNIKVARIFNTYGPKMHPEDGRVVSNFITQSLRNKNITIYGDGKQTRSFCYVDDLIDGLFKLMNSDHSIIGPMNLGNPEEFTILELANTIINLANSNSALEYKPLPLDDPLRRKPNIDLAVSKLGWEPKISLDEGVKKTIDYFKKYI